MAQGHTKVEAVSGGTVPPLNGKTVTRRTGAGGGLGPSATEKKSNVQAKPIPLAKDSQCSDAGQLCSEEASITGQSVSAS